MERQVVEALDQCDFPVPTAEELTRFMSYAENWVRYASAAFDKKYNPDDPYAPDITVAASDNLFTLADIVDVTTADASSEQMNEIIDTIFALANRHQPIGEDGDDIPAIVELQDALSRHGDSAERDGRVATNLCHNLQEDCELLDEHEFMLDVTELQAAIDGVAAQVTRKIADNHSRQLDDILNVTLCRAYQAVLAYLIVFKENRRPGTFNSTSIEYARETAYVSWKSGLADELRFVADALREAGAEY